MARRHTGEALDRSKCAVGLIRLNNDFMVAVVDALRSIAGRAERLTTRMMTDFDPISPLMPESPLKTHDNARLQSIGSNMFATGLLNFEF